MDIKLTGKNIIKAGEDNEVVAYNWIDDKATAGKSAEVVLTGNMVLPISVLTTVKYKRDKGKWVEDSRENTIEIISFSRSQLLAPTPGVIYAFQFSEANGALGTTKIIYIYRQKL